MPLVHRGVNEMIWSKAIIVGLLAGLVSTAAFAFQEQKGGVAGGGQAAPAESQAQGAAGNFATPEGEKAGGSSGAEVRIPGLGKLGVLPKMDFGLELLYGANEIDNSVEPPKSPVDEDDELTIRGTVKHRF